MGKVIESIKEVFQNIPTGHPSNHANISIKAGIFLLAEAIDKQNEKMKVAYDTSKEILVVLGKLDEKLEKHGL